MNNQSGKDKQQIIDNLKARLCWYAYEASEEEFDDAEVQAIVELLKVLNPVEIDEEYYSAEKSLERFWGSYESRQEIYEEFEKLKAGEVKWSDYPDYEETIENEEEEYKKLVAELNGYVIGGNIQNSANESEDGLHVGSALDPKHSEMDQIAETTGTSVVFEVREKEGKQLKEEKKQKKIWGANRRISGVVTAVIVVFAVFFGGTVGAYGQKEGFFHWIEKDEGNAVLIVPGEVGTNIGITRYNSFELLPDKYAELVWQPSEMSSEFELQYVEVIVYRVFTDIESNYKNVQTGEYINISQEVYVGDVAMTDEYFDSFIHLKTQTYDQIEVKYYMVENDGIEEYRAYYCYENQKYSVWSDISFDIFEDFIEKSIVNL